MTFFSKLFKKYTGPLRAWKGVYIINNLLNRDKLQHNKALYKKHGVRKSIYGAIGSHHFKKESNDIPWLDRPNNLIALEQHPEFSSFSKEIQEKIKGFIKNGYMVLENFYSHDAVDKLNKEVDRLLAQKATDFNYTGRKIMDAYKESELIDKDYFRNRELLRLLNFIMGKKVIPFQTIHFIEGSEQRAHSDSIHMMTQPLGYLIATWTALEDINENNGALAYYPKSHRLPYVTCQDYASGNSKYLIGKNSYKKYEDYIENLIKKHHLKKEFFFAKKGDVLLWHANLIHAGSPIKQKGATRRSMVGHYFCEGVICYHEISQRPALIEKSAVVNHKT